MYKIEETIESSLAPYANIKLFTYLFLLWNYLLTQKLMFDYCFEL